MNRKSPLYMQVANHLRENIRIEKWKPGSKIPTEYELCDLFHVSRITVRGAINELVKENLLVKKKPSGTFVTDYKNRKESMYTIVKGFTKGMIELGINPVTKKVDISLSHADARIAKFLNINPGDPICILKRLRGDKEKAFAYFITYFEYKSFFSLKRSSYTGSFYKYLSSLGITIEEDQEIVEAILPNKEIAQLLNITKNSPVLKRSRFTSDKHKNFYEYTECYYVGSEYRYFLNFSNSIYDFKN